MPQTEYAPNRDISLSDRVLNNGHISELPKHLAWISGGFLGICISANSPVSFAIGMCVGIIGLHEEYHKRSAS